MTMGPKAPFKSNTPTQAVTSLPTNSATMPPDQISTTVLAPARILMATTVLMAVPIAMRLNFEAPIARLSKVKVSEIRICCQAKYGIISLRCKRMAGSVVNTEGANWPKPKMAMVDKTPCTKANLNDGQLLL